MCTIAVLHGVHPEYPVIVAANRDEAYARAATGPEILAREPVTVAGGRDVVGGGTWTGVAASGLFVGITNQRTYRPPDAAPRSRGQVVLDALRAGSVAGVERYLRALDPAEFNAFNLMYGEAGAFHVAYVRPGSLELEALPPGIHVLANDRLGSREFPKTERVLALLQPLAERPWPELSRGLAAILADHDLPPPERVPAPPPDSIYPAELVRRLQAICIHTPGYGTRSAALVALAPGRVARYLATDGPPCTHAFRDFTALLDVRGPGAIGAGRGTGPTGPLPRGR